MWYLLPVWQVFSEHLHLGIQKMPKSWHLLPMGLASLGREKEVGLEIRRNHRGQQIMKQCEQDKLRSQEVKTELWWSPLGPASYVGPEVITASESLRTEVRNPVPSYEHARGLHVLFPSPCPSGCPPLLSANLSCVSPTLVTGLGSELWLWL